MKKNKKSVLFEELKSLYIYIYRVRVEMMFSIMKKEDK